MASSFTATVVSSENNSKKHEVYVYSEDEMISEGKVSIKDSLRVINKRRKGSENRRDSAELCAL